MRRNSRLDDAKIIDEYTATMPFFPMEKILQYFSTFSSKKKYQIYLPMIIDYDLKHSMVVDIQWEWSKNEWLTDAVLMMPWQFFVFSSSSSSFDIANIFCSVYLFHLIHFKSTLIELTRLFFTLPSIFSDESVRCQWWLIFQWNTNSTKRNSLPHHLISTCRCFSSSVISPLIDADLPNGLSKISIDWLLSLSSRFLGLEQKSVIIQRDRYGYGLTVSGDNPVFVLSVREGGAAQRAGIHVYDKIIKVIDNGFFSSWNIRRKENHRSLWWKISREWMHLFSIE